VDIEGLLRSLNAHSVDYVLIGATAFPVHGYARATLDVDIFMREAERATARLSPTGIKDSASFAGRQRRKVIARRRRTLDSRLPPPHEGSLSCPSGSRWTTTSTISE
jgi:hypothetical protein